MAQWQDADTLIIWLALGLLVLLVLVGAMLFFTRMYINRRMVDAQKLSNLEVAHQKQLLNDSIRVQEKERERIARDIHDELISKLNIMVLLAENNPNKAAEVLQTSIKTARRISHDLSPPMLEQHRFVELVESLLEHFKSGFELDYFASDPQGISLSKTTKLQVIRILQEVLNNILVHASAKCIRIGLRIAPRYLAIRIQDDGKGFDSEKVKNGLGLQNIEMRTQLLLGRHRLRSAPGKGTVYFFLFPLNSNAQ